MALINTPSITSQIAALANTGTIDTNQIVTLLNSALPAGQQISTVGETITGIYKRFGEFDKVNAKVEVVTTGLWTGDSGSLTAFYTASSQTTTNSGYYYFNVYNSNPDLGDNEEDKKHRDAMAARGYWLAFNSVKNSIEKIIDGGDLGKILSEEHSDWFRELFSPSVTSGILKPSDLAGYRRHQVYIGQSQHVPVNVDAVRDVMPILFELIAEEPEASVRAVLGHFIFVYIPSLLLNFYV